MKPTGTFDRPFRTAFIFLVSVSLVLMVWQCSQRPPGPARIDLHVEPAPNPAKTPPAP